MFASSPGDVCVTPTGTLLDQWLELARQAVDNGMVFLLLTGGEVFLRPDFFEIYTPLTRMGLVLTLFTNGTLITDEIASRLAEAPPSRTEITLYGATAETYEAVTGIPGSYARCISGYRGAPEKATSARAEVHAYATQRRGTGSDAPDGTRLGPAFFGGLVALQAARWSLLRGGELAVSPLQECVALEAADRASSR